MTPCARLACVVACIVALWVPSYGDTQAARSGSAHAADAAAGPLVEVYLRTYSTLAATDGEVVDLVEATLVRVPGLRVRIFIDPDDRGAATLADALANLPDDRTRCALLHILTRRITTRWADPDVIDAALRSLGRTIRTLPGQPRRFRPYARTAASPEAQALLRRTDELDGPGTPYAAIDGMHLSTSNVWSLMQSAERTTPVAMRETHSRTHGIALHTVGVRFPSYATSTSGRACALLESARPLVESGRIVLQLVVEDDPANASDTLISRALHASDSRVALGIADAMCKSQWPTDDAEAARLLATLSIPAERFVHVIAKRNVADASSTELLIDGNAASGYELSRLWDLPNVRARLSGSSRPAR